MKTNVVQVMILDASGMNGPVQVACGGVVEGPIYQGSRVQVPSLIKMFDQKRDDVCRQTRTVKR